MKMTAKQSWAIFCLAKIDMRKCDVEMEQASKYIAFLKKGGVQFDAAVLELLTIPGAVKTGTAKPKQDWAAVYAEAHVAGLAAGKAAIPEPMVVVGHANPLDDSSPVTERHFVSEGVCGFAWVVIHPGNCSFAVWARKQDLARAHYGGGVSVWVGEFNQSMTRKEAYAHAFAEVLNKHGVKAYAGSRMD
jgi:hypothetical protein